jgi:hypothetical protein
LLLVTSKMQYPPALEHSCNWLFSHGNLNLLNTAVFLEFLRLVLEFF